MLARLQSEYATRGLTVVAINIWASNYSLGEWKRFWKGTGAADVLWAQDINSSTIKDYRLVALGTEVIVDRQGSVTFRSDGASGYNRLRSEIEKVL